MYRKLKTVLRITSQSFLIVIFCLAGFALFHFRLPGNHTFTDNDAAPIALVYGVFIIIGIGLVTNAFFFILKKHWKKFRISVMVFVIGCLIAVYIPREWIIWTLVGNETSEFTSVNTNEPYDIWVNLKLFENNKFLCSSSNIHLTVENIGTYELTNTSLNLKFENEKSKFMGTTFKIVNDTLHCLDCNTNVQLIDVQNQ